MNSFIMIISATKQIFFLTTVSLATHISHTKYKEAYRSEDAGKEWEFALDSIEKLKTYVDQEVTIIDTRKFIDRDNHPLSEIFPEEDKKWINSNTLFISYYGFERMNGRELKMMLGKSEFSKKKREYLIICHEESCGCRWLWARFWGYKNVKWTMQSDFVNE